LNKSKALTQIQRSKLILCDTVSHAPRFFSVLLAEALVRYAVIDLLDGAVQFLDGDARSENVSASLHNMQRLVALERRNIRQRAKNGLMTFSG
jgi:hypothetical protein